MSNTSAIIWGTRHIDWPRLEQYVAAVIKHLKGRGIKYKDRLVIVENNSIEYVIVLLALWRMGVVACPINPKWPVESVLQCCSVLNPKAILTSQKQILSSKKTAIPKLELTELISFDARQQSPEVFKSEIPHETEATVIWTSGSSGTPKAAVHTWGNHFYSAAGSQSTTPLKAGDRWVLSLPLHHVSGISIVCRCLLAQAALIIPVEDDIVEVIRKNKPTHISLVATQLYRLMDNKDNHELLKSIKYILLGGSAIPASLLEKALYLGLPIYTSYGMTEMSSQVATGKVESSDKTCARLLPYRELKIDTNGEILLRGEVLFKGYLNQGRVNLPLTQDGWFRTGDLGRMDDGCLTVLGRVDNMFICAGENIQPEEIENVLMKMSIVRQAVVVAKQDAEYGHRPIAFVRIQGYLNPKLFEDHCAQYLPKIKIPVAFYPWPEEINQGLKVSRKFFQERLGNLLGE